MKKLLSFILCLTLTLVSIYFFPVSASSNSNPFDDAENWLVTQSNNGFGTTAMPGSGFATLNTDKTKTYGGDASSIRLNAFAHYATVKFEVTPNTEYVLSYQMYYDGTHSNDFIISASGITTLTGKIGFEANGTYDIITNSKSARCDDSVWATDTTATRGTLTDFAEGNKWHKITHSFNSKNNTAMVLAIRGGINDSNLYVDEFNLSTFEDIRNWGIYHPNAIDNPQGFVPTPTFDGESCQTKMSWCTITNDASEDADSSGKSIKITGDKFNVAVNLPTLKTNTEYTLSFKYKQHKTSKVYFTSHIIKKGTAFSADDMYPASYIAEFEKVTEAADWKELSVTFTTDNTTDYMLEFRFDFVSGYMCFLDDFNLTAKNKNTATITTSYNNQAAICTASASSTGKNGLRIYNSISKSFLNDNALTEYGSIVCCSELLGDTKLTINNKNAIKGVAYNSTTQATPILYDETGETYIFTAYLINIPTSKYDEQYAVRSYAIDDNGNVYYGDVVEVCVFDIAYAIDCGNSADGLAPTDNDIAAFKVFANYDGKFTAYDTWLEANSKEAGTLRNSVN